MFKHDLNFPQAQKKPSVISIHGDERRDSYYWLKLSDEQKEKGKEDPIAKQVLEYLEAENEYTQHALGDHLKFKDKLYQEIVERIPQKDSSVPYQYNKYIYQTHYYEGNEYPVFVRKKISENAEEEILLNVNTLAEGFDFYMTSQLNISPNNHKLVFGQDTLSRRQYTLRIKSLAGNFYYGEEIKQTTGSIAWKNDSKSFYYVKRDSITLRASSIYWHEIGMNPVDDVLIYHEYDERYSCGISKSKSGKYIFIHAKQSLANEYQIIDADSADHKLSVFQPRDYKNKLEYYIEHRDDHWIIRTNLDAENFRIMTVGLENTHKSFWKELFPHRGDVLLEHIEVFSNHLVLAERFEGLTEIRILRADQTHFQIEFPEKAHTVSPSVNKEISSHLFRLKYQSLTTPSSIYEFNLYTGELHLLKSQKLGVDYNSSHYCSERLMATGRDGTAIPISMVYHRDYKPSNKRPLLLYGYGSYGHSLDPSFGSYRLSLLNRGFVFAIAHVRGGEELGRSWYNGGKLLNKKNSFYDFIDCAEFLTQKNYTNKNNLFAMGGSAGGLLMGAIANLRPDLWKGIVAVVPFVDVVTTMLDEEIPLTTFEFDEWGNPKNKIFYDYIKSYSPYDNVEKKNYPAILVTTGLYDSQVQYWEPAKWVAKLRDYKKDENPLLLSCNMESGHSGASGRFKQYEDIALEFCFLLLLSGIKQ